MDPSARPDGIQARHADRAPWLLRNATPLSLLAFGALLAAALLGAFGGGKATRRTVAGSAATLSVSTPHVLRNGVFFETRISVTARRDIAKAVIAVSGPLWRDQTINTHLPAPGEESFADGAYRFDHGPLTAGDTLDVKIDGQINPPLFAGTSGTIALLDGETPLASVPLSIRVLP